MARKQSQEKLLADINEDLALTVKKRSYAYSSEHAGWLSHAAKQLLQIEDVNLKIELFLKIVLRALKLLTVVDDSNGSLQCVIYEGSYCFEVWKQICAVSEINTLKEIVEKVLSKDGDGLSLSIFFPKSTIPLSDDTLRLLLEDITQRLKAKKKYQREIIARTCLSGFAQLKDEAGFNRIIEEAGVPKAFLWSEYFTLYLHQARYDEARELLFKRTEDCPYHRPHYLLKLFEHTQDRAILREVALILANDTLSLEKYNQLNNLLNPEEHDFFIDTIYKNAQAKKGLNLSFCEILFSIKALDILRNYLCSRYDEIFSLSCCTGMVPLAKKLAKDGEHLAAVILLRGAITYLMGRKNSKYYNDIHRHYHTLTEVSRLVSDWNSIPPPRIFNNYFAQENANRRTFWWDYTIEEWLELHRI